MTKDIAISEFGSGGDVAIIGNDLALSEKLLQAIYIALFGGNLEAVTQGNELEGQERNDYWANGLLWSDENNKQFNSVTENTLCNVVLNSSGRLQILSAVEKDLEFLSGIANVDVDVSILTYNRVEISVKISRLDNLQEKQLQMVFDNAKNELITFTEI
ncbi:hypothetical protein C7967_11545 [Thalassospira sp. 11-3]|nr:hypothetical protein C7967_11545 [Thalassospira sp. 11-3]